MNAEAIGLDDRSMGFLFGLAAMVAIAWLALARTCVVRSRWAAHRRPSPIPAPDDAPEVVAVVPAHDEADHIGELLRCLRGQSYPNLSVVVVDDESTDGTARIVLEVAPRTDPVGHPIRLISGTPRPEGWVGKTWALQQGISSTDAGWIWMVDADLWLHPDALSTAVEEAVASGADVVSFLGRPRCETFWQASIALTLVQILSMLYPLRRVNDPVRSEALAHGAFILIRRSIYDRIGGIAALRGEIVEDIRLAERVKASGGRLLVRAAPGLSQTHMYGSFGHIWRGLRKNAFAGMDYRLHKFATGAALGLLMAWTPPIALLTGLMGLVAGWSMVPSPIAWLAVGALGWFSQAIATVPVVIYLQIPFVFALTLPAGLAAYVAITASSVWHHGRGRILWKDRLFPASTSSIGRASASRRDRRPDDGAE